MRMSKACVLNPLAYVASESFISARTHDSLGHNDGWDSCLNVTSIKYGGMGG